MANYNIKISQDLDEDLSVKEIVFFRYMSELRGMLIDQNMIAKDILNYTEYLNSGNPLDEIGKKNIQNSKERFEKVSARIAKFNQFMASYDEIRKTAYEFFKINNQNRQ